MPKRTAVIDIGSNSARLVIFQRSSRFGFHLICEQKSKVRIGEGAYLNGGYLQQIAIQRAYLALQSFMQTIKRYSVKKTICVATSALRDAPNSRQFIEMIREKLKLSIKIIDGNEEARLGAIATTNLLPIKDAITIDIGGGSCDLALIRGGHIVQTHSINVGTVRIKELFFDDSSASNPMKKAREYIAKEFLSLPSSFRGDIVVGIGGTARTLSRGVMKRHSYPLNKLHAFSYSSSDEMEYFEEIIDSSHSKLSNLHIKKGRYDTIKEGALIFVEIIKLIGAKEVMSSSVGVREGIFLKDLLRNNNYKFPSTLNPSIKSILDRFDRLTPKASKASHRIEIASSLYDIYSREFGLDRRYQDSLNQALKLSNIGKILTIYSAKKHAFYISMEELNFGFRHEEMILVSTLLHKQGNSLLNKSLFESYKSLLPPKEQLKILNFIFAMTILLHENSNSADIRFEYSERVLTIISDQSLYLAKEGINSLDRLYLSSIIF
jgi:exopolyphosphatase/guanosine-5'-triphosphate,3'-diphosphate pyrophosphatase